MASRHLSRSIALQTLYEWDFRDKNEEKLDAVIEKNLVEFGTGLDDAQFVRDLIKGVLAHREALDQIIEKAAPAWPLDQIAIVDRNILRLGLYELLFGDRSAVPPKVAINEAIELAKSFGGEASGRFVNGVLGTVYREIGEPGKDDAPHRSEGAKKPSDSADTAEADSAHDSAQS
ncbi:MAG: transcription antitermination factor NusB [Candidatus Paceibacterota bacterium]|nr:MAG: transcription antitermination factor NusB [Candidatus Paceibacterota bacterium]